MKTGMANSVKVCVEQFFSYVLNVIILTTDFLPARNTACSAVGR